MKFLLDENVEYRLSAFLKTQGHDVTAIARDYPHGLPDREVLAIAVAEGRILLTSDRDFGELVFQHGIAQSGVILLRLPAGHTDAKIDALAKLLVSHADRLDQFIVVNRRGVRVRRPRVS